VKVEDYEGGPLYITGCLSIQVHKVIGPSAVGRVMTSPLISQIPFLCQDVQSNCCNSCSDVSHQLYTWHCYCPRLLISVVFLHIDNLILLRVRQHLLDREPPPLKVQEETNTDGIIFLYWQQQQIYLSVSHSNSYLLWLYSLWNNNKDSLLFKFFLVHLNLEPQPKRPDPATTHLWNPQNLHVTVCFWSVRKFPDEYEASQMSNLVLSSVTSWQYLQGIN